MRQSIFFRSLLVISCLLFSRGAFAQNTSKVSLAGSWELLLDPRDEGLQKHFWGARYPDTVTLPGSLTENGKGDEVSINTPWTGDIFDSTYFFSEKYAKYRQGNIKIPFWLQPVKYYAGPAWYRRKIAIPDSWNKKRVVLNLERCHWETMVYINGRFAGTRNSLVAPHRFDLSGYLKPGDNTIVIRVDNRIKLHIGPNSHSIADHTQTNWNGVVGAMSLAATDAVFFEDIQVYPDIKKQMVRLEAVLRQGRHQDFKGLATFEVKDAGGKSLPVVQKQVAFAEETGRVSVEYPISNPALWDEFSPNLYQLAVRLADSDGQAVAGKELTFGMREVGSQGTRLTINGRPVFLRGDVDCASFPLTGYPPTDDAAWEKIMVTLKDHGLNHLRFHSWCPPDAAFRAADKKGVYLYVESPLWANQGSAVGTDGVIDTFIYQETERLLKEYGNHPSFCLMGYGNEPGGAHQNAFLGRWVDHFKQADVRRLFTSGAGWPLLPENQFHLLPHPRIQGYGQGLKSIINGQRPRTNFDWEDIIKPAKVPYVSHEIGQWCVYPNFHEINKYKGVLKATNFEIFKETLEANAMGDQADAFVNASGRLQTICYKADIEAALRTPGFGGFQLLGLHDFPGQGTALVGALDAFYEPKPYTNAKEYRRFCAPTVLLARMEKLVYHSHETLNADLEIAHFGAAELTNQKVSWQLVDARGNVKEKGMISKDVVRIDNAQTIGKVSVSLASFKSPQQLQLRVSLAGTDVSNSWDIWVYPPRKEVKPGGILIVNQLTDNVIQQIRDGASVLLLPYGHVKQGKGAEVQIGFSTVFWNTSWTQGQAPHTLGLLCDPKHPLFAAFPTEPHSNYQWFDIVSKSQTIILDGFPSQLRPLVQPIDTWFENRRLSLVFEGKIGKGKLLVCSADLETDLGQRPAAGQFRASLLGYMNSKQFNPAQALDADAVKALFDN